MSKIMKQDAQKHNRALELYFEGKHNELEQLLMEMAHTAPTAHRRAVDDLATIIDQQSMLDCVGDIELW